MRKDHVRLEGDEFLRQLRDPSTSRGVAIIDLDVAALSPSQPLKLLSKTDEAWLHPWIVRSQTHEHANPPNTAGLLRVCCHRPCDKA
jgi:hypothetical protein